MTSGVLAGLACALGAGIALTMAGVGAQIRIQTAVDPALRARVLSLYGLAMRGGPALGALAMGFAADRVGLRWPLLVGAAAVSLLWLPVWARRARIARSLERP